MQSGNYLGLLRRWWLTFLVAVVVGAVAGWFVARSFPENFQSRTRLLVGPVNAGFDTIRAASQLTETYVDLATSDRVLGNAISRAELILQPAELANAVRATADAQARIVTIEVQLPSADASASAANAVAEALAAFAIAESARPEGELRVIDPALATGTPVGARAELVVLLSALGALLGAVLLVSAVEVLDGTIRDTDQLRRIAGPAFLGTVPLPLPTSRLALRAGREPAGVHSAYRTILGDLFARALSPVRSILVVSAGDAVDAHRVTAGLVAAATQLGGKIVLIEADDDDAHLASSLVAQTQEERVSGGLWSGRASREPDQVAGQSDDVRVVPDPHVRHPSAAIEVFSRIVQNSDLVVVDAGSSRSSFTAASWARAADSVVIVTRLGRDQRTDLQQALERLEVAPGATAWVVAADPVRTRRRRRARQQLEQIRREGIEAQEEPSAKRSKTFGAEASAGALGTDQLPSPRHHAWHIRSPHEQSGATGEHVDE